MVSPKHVAIFFGGLGAAVLAGVKVASFSVRENYGEFGEYNEFCRWDSRRFCTLSDGSSGKCVMNALCVPPLVEYSGPDLVGSGLLSPALRAHSPVAPTWKWGNPQFVSSAEIESAAARNLFSNKYVMQYVNEVPLPPGGPLPPLLPEALAALSNVDVGRVEQREGFQSGGRRRRRLGTCGLVLLVAVVVAVALGCTVTPKL